MMIGVLVFVVSFYLMLNKHLKYLKTITKGMKEIILYVFGENPTGFHEDKMDVAKLKEVFTNAGYKCK